jgi:ferredoxin
MSSVNVNRIRCQSNGVCEALVPEVFEIDDDGALRIKTDRIGPEQLGQVSLAIASCPTQALSLVHD